MLAHAGYRGRVHGTWATTDLCGIMLLDSAHIQEKDVSSSTSATGAAAAEPRAALHHGRRGEDPDAPSRTAYDTPFEVAPGISILYGRRPHARLGHRGGAHCRRAPPAPSSSRGDWGRKRMPILRDPVPVPAADILIVESTYGDKVHPPALGMADAMLEVLRPVFARRQGHHPAFAVGRTQTAVYELGRLMRDGLLPRVPVYVDSAAGRGCHRGHAAPPRVLRRRDARTALQSR
jgi:metallo-beta-lactamase family protein